MTQYRIGYRQTELRVCRVNADSPDDANRKLAAGAFAPAPDGSVADWFDMAEDRTITFIEAVLDDDTHLDITASVAETSGADHVNLVADAELVHRLDPLRHQLTRGSRWQLKISGSRYSPIAVIKKLDGDTVHYDGTDEWGQMGLATFASLYQPDNPKLRLRSQFCDLIEGYSEERWAASWLAGIEHQVRAEGGIWLVLALAAGGWPKGYRGEDGWEPLTEAERTAATATIGAAP